MGLFYTELFKVKVGSLLWLLAAARLIFPNL
jgi:hypothetical protein